MINLTKPIESSFFSCEKDTELILEKLFIQNRQKGNELKRLLVINTPDCLDTTNAKYQQIVENKSIKDLILATSTLVVLPLSPSAIYEENPSWN